MVNYFNKYGSTQLEIAKEWIDQNEWLKEIVTEIGEDSTSFHDVRFKTSLDPNRWYTIEVKEDERYWYDRTKNVGLDAISSFTIKNNYKKWMPYGNKGAWIKSSDFEDFKKDINVSKWGKLFTCDADIQLFYVEGKILKAYSNKLIVCQQFQNYVTKNYDLRINNKKRYGIYDNWMSATYLFKPETDEQFIKIEIKCLKDFLNL